MTRLHLFQAFGVELEYMIVDKDSLMVKPLTDELLKHVLGTYGSDYDNGMVTWSNELVLHVVELKSSNPEINFSALEHQFAENVRRINAILLGWNAMLMPTAAHPFMNPHVETKLWPHDNNDVYEIYNRIFDCRGHGWSNLQSTHLNLPFYDDEEFASLHAAVRLILPMLPALCASSPMLDGKYSGLHDTRLHYYKTNQAKLPSITGKVIPEQLFSKRNYLNGVYEKIKVDIAPYDKEEILDPIWVNSRGAIPRFDRGSIEIRVMDIQECPTADLAIVTLVIETLRALVKGEFISYGEQIQWTADSLANILDKTIVNGHETLIDDAAYLNVFGMASTTRQANEVWEHILQKLIANGHGALQRWKPELDIILKHGTLAYRIKKALGTQPDRARVVSVYKKLSSCLAQNKMFLG
ncbi:carboxylate-amine ligase [Pseudochryseolinea flava]|uniref:Glutamate--cysteine ligase n=1 Tax=Pseudochryseolinea flava TaxID=2059302 RepID=A0A364Y231_9BACT|nr:glutamate-cysteine ligase family protein [Pseudochryseolinea flava]RAW00774.1 glutamate--cysteine ligase [Pseudochryseolinea flava]